MADDVSKDKSSIIGGIALIAAIVAGSELMHCMRYIHHRDKAHLQEIVGESQISSHKGQELLYCKEGISEDNYSR